MTPGPEGDTTRATGPVGRVTVWVFLSALLLYVGTAGGSLTSSDASIAFDLTRNIVDHHSVALSSNMPGSTVNVGLDGRPYSQQGLGYSLYTIPFFLAGRAMEARFPHTPGPPDTITKATVAMSSTVAAATAVAIVFAFAFALSRDGRAALLSAATAAAGSLLWPYATFGFNATLAAALLTASAWTLWLGTERHRTGLIGLAGLLVGALWLTRHEGLLIGIAGLAWLLASVDRTRLRSVVPAYLAGLAVGGTAWMAYNVSRFGTPFEVGHHPGYGGQGYLGLLVYPGASVFVYTPSIILGLGGLLLLARRGQGATAWLLGGPGLIHYAFVGALEDWVGGRAYGPRYLVACLPLLAVAAVEVYGRPSPAPAAVSDRPRFARVLNRTAVPVLLISSLLQLPGVLVDYSRVSFAWARAASPTAVSERLEHWRSSPLVLNVREAATSVPRNLAILAGRATPPPIVRDAGDQPGGFSQQFAFSLDFWWLYLVYLHVLPPAAGVAIGIGLILASLWAGRRAWRLGAALSRSGAPMEHLAP
ncbi:MAG: hypothetical protein R2752_18530 [Vicinamibacterales bacterium]